MNYVIIGSSAAGINAARELRSLDQDAAITMISKDETIYSRCIIHHYLSDRRTLPQLNFAEPDFFEKFRIQFMGGVEVTGLDTEKKVVLTSSETVSYDKLLIASGSNSFMPPIENLAQTEDAIGFRNIEDVEKLKAVAKEKQNIVVLGAGLVGMDCVSGLVHLGLTPTLVDLEKHVLIRQLDDKASVAYQNKLEASGVKQLYGIGVSKLNLDGTKLVSLTLSDGTEIPCDFLVVTIGVRSNVAFLKDSGVDISKFGLIFDEYGRTNVEDIYGAGDVSGLAPIWPVAVKEGIIAANNMYGNPHKMSNFFASKSTMNFFGIPTMSLGDVNLSGDDYTIETKEDTENYKKIIHKDGVIVGALLQGDLSYSGILQQLIMNKIDVRHVKKSIFDIDYSDFFQMDDNFEFYYK